jgi:hypothetical protein
MNKPTIALVIVMVIGAVAIGVGVATQLATFVWH